MASQTRQRKHLHVRMEGDRIPPSSPKIRQHHSQGKLKKPALCTYDELPKWHQDNELVLAGYRPPSNSVRTSFESWFYMHNETINIFSHLIPGIYFLAAHGLIYHFFEVHYPKSSNMDRLIFAFFFSMVTVCFLMSSTYHTLMNHSDDISHFLLRLDFVGIVIHTLGNFVSGIYVTFYCEPALQKLYWGMVSSSGKMRVYADEVSSRSSPWDQ